jgi:hypothetical protein
MNNKIVRNDHSVQRIPVEEFYEQLYVSVHNGEAKRVFEYGPRCSGKHYVQKHFAQRYNGKLSVGCFDSSDVHTTYAGDINALFEQNVHVFDVIYLVYLTLPDGVYDQWHYNTWFLKHSYDLTLGNFWAYAPDGSIEYVYTY